MKNNKIFIGIIICIIVFFVYDRSLSYLLTAVIDKSGFRYSRFYNNRIVNKNIFAIGNSRVVNSFYELYINDRYKLGLSNLGYNGLSIRLADILIRDGIELYHPKTIVLELTMIVSEKRKGLTGNDSMLNVKEFASYSNYSKLLLENIKKSYPLFNLVTNIFHIYRFNNNLFLRNLYYINKNDVAWINTYVISDSLISELGNREDINLEISVSGLDKLKEIIDHCKSEGVDIKLVITPWHPKYREKIVNLDEIIATIEKETGYTVYDFSKINLEKKAWADRLHTNRYGARKLFDIIFDSGIFSNSELSIKN